MRKKVVFFIVDGLADLPIKNTTPLKSAKTPNLDWLAANGGVGELNLIPRGMGVKSHVADVSLLGYNPAKFYLKRGPLEAVGADIPFQEGHLALRCNFSTMERGVITDRRAGRNSYGLPDIARYINENIKLDTKFTFLRTYGHRAVLILKEKLSDAITDNDPLVDGEKVKEIKALKPEAERSAKLITDFINQSHDVIKYHPKNAERMEQGIPPANYIIVREAGNRLQAYPNFLKKWKLKKAVCIAEIGITKAICMLAGFNAVTIPDLPYKESLDFVFENIEELLPDYQFILAHIKGPDEPAHDGNFKKKQQMIEILDKKLSMFKDFTDIFVLTADHITSCEKRAHQFGSVPVVVYGRSRDKVKTFDEFSAKKGKLKKYNGLKLLKYIFRR